MKILKILAIILLALAFLYCSAFVVMFMLFEQPLHKTGLVICTLCAGSIYLIAKSMFKSS